MAISSSFSLPTFLLILQVLMTCTLCVNACYTSIISFGDSLTDTGNVQELPSLYNENPAHFLFPPYGETYFHRPTGRCSDGRLIIDFLAENFGLSSMPSYLSVKRNGHLRNILGQGVNYAVSGATALDSSFHEARGHIVDTNASLGVQLQWFKQSLPFFCNSPSDCKNLIRSSLIIMGEIGGNDYNDGLIAGKSIDEAASYIPLVINTIISAVNDLIELGAETLVIPGNLPIGCLSVYLTMYFGSNTDEYDNTTGCLTRLNKFAEHHNELLQKELNKIRELHPNVNIIYADYYNAAMQIFRSPNDFGFSNGALKACCGSGGPFNYNSSAKCATPSSTTCAQPDTYANWDGIHLTEAAYKLIYNNLFQGTYTMPQFNSFCPMLQTNGGLLSST